MKKWILFFVLSLAVQASCHVAPVFAQKDEDVKAIQDVIKGFLDATLAKNIDAVMEYVSSSYNDTANDGSAINYAVFKAMTEQALKNGSETRVSVSISDIKIFESDIRESAASIKVEFVRKSFNLKALVEQSTTHKSDVSLIKENDKWKITRWKIVRTKIS